MDVSRAQSNQTLQGGCGSGYRGLALCRNVPVGMNMNY